jgi:hypothetical protein
VTYVNINETNYFHAERGKLRSDGLRSRGKAAQAAESGGRAWLKRSILWPKRTGTYGLFFICGAPTFVGDAMDYDALSELARICAKNAHLASSKEVAVHLWKMAVEYCNKAARLNGGKRPDIGDPPEI